MKKSTKVLLVLAAIVAMTIGAVSTVMAADYPTVATWGKNNTATDAAGNAITNGWAVSSSGIWYYFDNGAYLTNSFITYGGDIYFLGAEGAMCTNWVKFDVNTSIKYDGRAYNDVAEAFNCIDILGSVPFSGDNNGAYEKVWCFFDASGKMQIDKWIVNDGLWYYMFGPFCLINESAVVCPVENGSPRTATYGFGGNGNMHVGWVKIKTRNAATATTPWGSNTNAAYVYAYYDASGKLAKGWTKIDNQWYFFKEDSDYGAIMVSDIVIIEGSTYGYIDTNGVMTTGITAIAAGSSKDRTVNAYKINGTTLEYQSDENLSIKKNETLYLNIKADGKFDNGVKGDYYYAVSKKDENVFIVNLNDNGETVVEKYFDYDRSVTLINKGARLSGNFFVKSGNDIYYYSAGKLVKNAAIKFFDITFVFGSNGKLVQLKTGENTTLNGVKYYATTDSGSLKFGEREIKGVTTKKSTVTVTGSDETVKTDEYTKYKTGSYYAGQKVTILFEKLDKIDHITVNGRSDVIVLPNDGSTTLKAIIEVLGDTEIIIYPAAQ